MKSFCFILLVILSAFAVTSGCLKKTDSSPAAATPHKHEHKPPHGGTPVVLGDEVYHLELVLDRAAGRLDAYVFDGELENFIRSSVSTFEIDAFISGASHPLIFNGIANAATGETVGDTSYFQAQADWLKTVTEFDGVLKTITIRGTTFRDIKFNFPKGNDKD